jgi:polyisoprenoid-binding protein YceI
MKWNIDPQHTDVSFSVRHMMISNVRGRFEQLEGVVDYNPKEPEKSSADVKIKADTINTRDPQRDGHLKSADFLNAEKYPHLHFKSNRIEVTSDTTGRIYGDLTIREETHPVVLDVTYNGMAKSPYGGSSAGFSATTTIKRKDWNLTWNVALETGGMLVGEEVKINVDVELIQEQEAQG